MLNSKNSLKLKRDSLAMNLKVGRAVLCAPRTWKNILWLKDGAHGVTRPTLPSTHAW
jgi:hypothetical protein